MLNKERVDEYTRAGKNIFEDAADPKYSVILMTPEMLSSKPARALIQKPAMQKRQGSNVTWRKLERPQWQMEWE